MKSGSAKDRLTIQAGAKKGARSGWNPFGTADVPFQMNTCKVWFLSASDDLSVDKKRSIAKKIDEACNEASGFINSLMISLSGVSLESGTVPADVAAALKFHFKVDAAVPGNQKQFRRIYRTYEKMKLDYAGGMQYVYEVPGINLSFGNPAYVHSLNPQAVHVHKRLLKAYSGRDLAWALVHEQAHYSSRSGWIPMVTVKDRTYFGNDKESTVAYPKLSCDQAVTNADCYVFLAMDLVDPTHSDIVSMHSLISSP
ncbi:MAG: hypothetical protein HY000_38865 [Planctomycetes bacterium]|nr:hypothetical protein [Planctomycetota bacterium]